MKVCIKWVENAMFIGESGSGHAVVMDGSSEGGGRNMGFRPLEMLLLGLGGCTTYDVIHILKKSRQSVTDCKVEIISERSDKEPKVFTKIHVHFIVSGSDMKESVVKRAVDLSTEKYCSASIMLGKSAEMSHSFEIISE